MADNETPQGETPAETPEPQEPRGTDWKAESRKWESRAKENLATAKANEDAARRLADIEEAQKTEAQKAQERVEAAEKRASELELRSLRAEVAAEKGVPVGLLSGSTKEALEAAADALIEFRGVQAQSPDGPIAPGEGSQRSDRKGLTQLTQGDIDSMSPQEINDARRAGRLNKLLGII